MDTVLDGNTECGLDLSHNHSLLIVMVCASLNAAELNAAARLIYGRRKYDHVTPLLREFNFALVASARTHYLPVGDRCQHNMAPHYRRPAKSGE